MATDDFWDRFRRWRQTRPFWGGLFLVLASILFFLSANLHPFGNITINLGPAGFLSYVIPVVILLCGLLGWFTPAQRIFYGIIALVTSLYSLVSLNFGGWGVSMFVGFAGGALLIAWGPPRVKPGAKLEPAPTGQWGDDATPPPSPPAPAPEPADAPTERVEVAGHDDRATEDVRPPFIPGMEPEEPPRRAFRGKALGVALIALCLVASLLVAGGSMPARAEPDCPEGLPHRSTSPSASSAAPSSSESASASASASPSASASEVLPVTAHSPGPVSPSVPASRSPSATASAEDGKSILDGVHEVVGGVGDLLGLNGDESASPSPSASPTPPPTDGSSDGSSNGSSNGTSNGSGDPSSESADPATGPSAPGADPSAASSSAAASSAPAGAASAGAASAEPDPSPTSASSAEPDPSASELPCLDPRIFGKVSDGDGIATNAVKPGLQQVDKLTLIGATYEGVVDIPTGDGGTMKALQFNMTKAINDGFKLTVDEPGGTQTIFDANQLITDQNVRFYTPRFEGKFGGLIPMTFTPEQPPPIMLALMVFTDVSIDLAHVRCDTLTSTPLQITETS